MYSDIAECSTVERARTDADEPSGAGSEQCGGECGADSGRRGSGGDIAGDSGIMGDAGQRWDELDCYAVLAEYQRFRDRFISILDPALYTPAWLDCMVLTGQFRLFTSERSAILASIHVYPTGLKEVRGEAAVGNLGELIRHAIPQAEVWARSQDCTLASIQSRPGWIKMMKHSGYDLHQSCIRKVL